MVKSKIRSINTFVLFLMGAGIAILILIVSGYFDPKPYGSVIWQQELFPIEIGSKSSEIRWLAADLPDSPISVRLTANHASGEIDTDFGLLLGQGETYVAIAVSPLGNVAIWEQSDVANSTHPNYHLPWQTWPHVRTDNEVNEILILLDGDILIVRLNREWLWEGSGFDQIEGIGIFGVSYGQNSIINFQLAEIAIEENE